MLQEGGHGIEERPLKEFAAKALPKLEDHLKLANETGDQLK